MAVRRRRKEKGSKRPPPLPALEEKKGSGVYHEKGKKTNTLDLGRGRRRGAVSPEVAGKKRVLSRWKRERKRGGKTGQKGKKKKNWWLAEKTGSARKRKRAAPTKKEEAALSGPARRLPRLPRGEGNWGGQKGRKRPSHQFRSEEGLPLAKGKLRRRGLLGIFIGVSAGVHTRGRRRRLNRAVIEGGPILSGKERKRRRKEGGVREEKIEDERSFPTFARHYWGKGESGQLDGDNES